MPDSCKQWQGLLAEHFLTAGGRRDADLAPMPADLAEHVAGCVDCQAVASEFRATARALAFATAPSTTAVAPPPPAGLVTRIATRVDQERHRRARRHRVVAAVAVAAAIVTIGVWTVAVRNPPSTDTATERVTLDAAGVRGDATLREQAWGTQIQLSATGFTPGQRYVVWLERADGTRVAAGSFMGVRSRQITAVLASSLASSEAVAIGISDPDGVVLLRAVLA